MKKVALIFPLMVFGLVMGAQDVRGQNPQNADLHPPYLPEEELAIQDGEEGSVVEEDEITGRGVRRFKFKKQSRPRILVPKKPVPGKKKFRLKRRPLVTPPGATNTPPVEESPPLGEPPGPTEPSDSVHLPPALQCEWKTSDIIDPRIEISAQQSLMRMMSHGGIDQRAASAMIGAIKNGTLAGIHAPFLGRKASVDRAATIPPPGTRGYWTLLPKGEIGLCLKEPVGTPPMLLYREKNMHPSVIDHTLRTQWEQCGLFTPDPPCAYVVDLHKPELECSIHQDCVDKGLGNFCTPENTCETHFDDDNIDPPPPSPFRCTEQGQCNADVPAVGDQQCGGELGSCRKVPGQECGVCTNTPEKRACIEETKKQYKIDVQKCDDEELNTLKSKCPKEFATCASCFFGSLKSCKDCLQGERCILGGPSSKRIECGGRAAKKQQDAIQECMKR